MLDRGSSVAPAHRRIWAHLTQVSHTSVHNNSLMQKKKPFEETPTLGPWTELAKTISFDQLCDANDQRIKKKESH